MPFAYFYFFFNILKLLITCSPRYIMNFLQILGSGTAFITPYQLLLFVNALMSFICKVYFLEVGKR
jgi:hypothetical protein